MLSKQTIIKLILLVLIVIVPFVDYKKFLAQFDITTVKVIMLLAIAFTSFYSLEIAILLTILFFLIIINDNVMQIKKISDYALKKEDFIMKDFPTIQCSKNEPLQNPFSYYVDEKIKPYEEYVKLISNVKNVEQASSPTLVS